MAKYQIYGVRHTYIVWNNSGAYAYKRVYMTNACELKVGGTDLEFSGDNQKFKRHYGYEADGTVEAHVDDDGLDAILFPTPKVNPAGGDDFAVRYIKGGDAENQTNFVEVRVTLDGEDADTGAPVVERLRILRCQFSPDTPAKMQSQAVFGRMLAFTARRTLTDIIGATPTGMPSRGCYWLKDYITNTGNFDPVAGDIL